MVRRLCCCCPANSETSEKQGSLRSIFGPRGIQPNVVQVLAPLLYQYNEELSLSSVGRRNVGYPEDPNYPTDSRSDPFAWTPMYRGGQTIVYDVAFTPYSFHGVGSESESYTDGTWYEWDGITTFPIFCPDTYTEAQKIQYRKDWYDFVFPGFSTGNFCIRGLKQLYESVQPFQDESNPTVREWEIWNDVVFNHFRTLSGLNPVTPLQELYIRCKWSKERKTTSIWDSYSGVLDSAYGPCIPGTNIHCGSTFTPSTVDEQVPYWNQLYVAYPKIVKPDLITSVAGETEAITVWYNGTAMTAFSRNLRKLFEATGTSGEQIGGHAGSYAFRPYYGLSIGRAKFTGVAQSSPPGFTY